MEASGVRGGLHEALLVRRMLMIALLTAAGAGVVSLLRNSQIVVAGVLVIVILIHLARLWIKYRNVGRIAAELFIVFTTGVIGYLTESWGTSHGHWTYYHLPPGQGVPYWVPLAWSLAGILLHKLEQSLEDTSYKDAVKVGLICTWGVLFPLLGESICIAAGVWEYHWPYKIAGVPALALVLISYAHLTFTLIRQGLSRTSGPMDGQC